MPIVLRKDPGSDVDSEFWRSSVKDSPGDVPGRRSVPERGYIPALRLRLLTRLYDPLMERWTAAGPMRQAVIDALDLRPGLRALELGSGPGRLAIEIKRRAPCVIVDAVDVDPEMVEQAKRNALEAGVEINFWRTDMTTVAGPSRYDRIYSTLVFHHLQPDGKAKALAGVRAALQPEGRFIVADFGRPAGWWQWLVSYSIQPLDGIANTAPHRSGEFERMLQAAFSRVDLVALLPTFAGTLKVITCSP